MYLEIEERSVEHFVDVVAFAAKAGKLEDLKKNLKYLATYSDGNYQEYETKAMVYKDFAPQSFSFCMYQKPKTHRLMCLYTRKDYIKNYKQERDFGKVSDHRKRYVRELASQQDLSTKKGRWEIKRQYLRVARECGSGCADWFMKSLKARLEHRKSLISEARGKWFFWFNGGLIFHGQHDNGGDGGMPTLSVCLQPTDGWSIHT